MNNQIEPVVYEGEVMPTATLELMVWSARWGITPTVKEY